MEVRNDVGAVYCDGNVSVTVAKPTAVVEPQSATVAITSMDIDNNHDAISCDLPCSASPPAPSEINPVENKSNICIVSQVENGNQNETIICSDKLASEISSVQVATNTVSDVRLSGAQSGAPESNNLSCCDNIPETDSVTSVPNRSSNAKDSDVSLFSSENNLCNNPGNDSNESCTGNSILNELNEALCDISSNNEVICSKDHEQQRAGSPVSSSGSEEKIASLQKELERLKSDLSKSRDDYYVEVQVLERALAQERIRHQQQEDSATKAIAQLKHDLDKKKQHLDSTIKDRESMVVKYAVSEKTVINLRQELETALRKLKEANRSRDLLSDRLKTVQLEKERANNLLETKGQELSTLNRENQRLKEDLRWTQNKLKSESESKKDAEHRITDLIRKVEESRLQVEQANKDSQAFVKNFQESQENRAVVLDQQLRELQAQLILERHEKADSEAVLKQLHLEVDGFKKKQQALITENNQLSLKVQTLEKERLEGDQRVSRLKQDSDSHHQEVADLRERLTEMESLRAQLQHHEDQLATCRNEIERLRQSNTDLQQDASSCREREAELLDFTQKLTEKNVRLQSEFSALEAKAQMLENEQIPLMKKLTEAEGRVAALSKQIEDEQRERQEESSLLARHLAEKTLRTQQLQQQLEDSQGEIEVLKRKHATSVRELTRELQHAHKRQENTENNGSGSSGSGSTSLGQGSRASSTSSLNNVCEAQASPPIPTIVFPNGMEPDKQVLIERLVKLQRENARKAEKLDFLEEHNQTLLSELQKKSRIIQNYVVRAPAGALSSDKMDQNKAELAKRSGIMASMYGSKTDEAMTLELSMEINRKLQAVLEDTLLKNITLKENMDTLGSEIARLSHKK